VIVLALVLALQQDSAATKAQLEARGLPADLSASVAAVATHTAQQGLPARAIVDKAIEGFFKHVPPPRIIAAVRDLSDRLGRARADLRSAGVAQADGSVIAGAAEASAQGITSRQEVSIIHAAPSSDAAGAGLSVAAALVVQGIEPAMSARLVTEAFAHGQNVAQVLDLPAAARSLQVQGATSTEIGRQLLDGIAASGTVTGRAGAVVRPVVPPVRVP
jgi:hypothetical protein